MKIKRILKPVFASLTGGMLLVANAFASQCAGPNINGWNTGVVNHFSGSFIEKNDRNWVENNSDGRHTYYETARDEWSVYLKRSDNYYDLQLDLHRCGVYFKRPSDANYELLYKIKSAH
ncbi:hypothetical protein H0A36_22710 [Endozoicomonas sp. SM1973]|uniref:Uncharacterized protein n=1 Tax=Spartinivicinus marinus TaxID=2994442 RepID=A0A853IFM8_9GAMM|nr:hypothetical protein [Spartinivicinus marinus]MCX4025896.1 hypothetical protein [Spartinivicinus marinus]NYZ68834.1 hypothetical protein [Spartinivicinus marinus]